MAELTFKERYDLANDRTALERLAVAVVNVAKDVYVEADTEPNHALRQNLVAYAGPTFKQFKEFTLEMALVVFALNAELTKESSDQDYEDAVSGLWTAYAQLLALRGTIQAT